MRLSSKTIRPNKLAQREALTDSNTLVIGRPPTTSILSSPEQLNLLKRKNSAKNATLNATAGPSKLPEPTLRHSMVRNNSMETIFPSSRPASVVSAVPSYKRVRFEEEDDSEPESRANIPLDSLELLRDSLNKPSTSRPKRVASSQMEPNIVGKGKQREVPRRQLLVKEAMGYLRTHHDCSHPDWDCQQGTGRCHYCNSKLLASHIYVSNPV